MNMEGNTYTKCTIQSLAMALKMIRDIENTHQVAAIFQMEDGDKTNVPNVMKNVK